MPAEPLTHLLRQLSPENRQWLESQPEDKQRIIAAEWEPTEGPASHLLASIDLLPELMVETAAANAYVQEIRDNEEY
ncbi:hypothetical protein [Streptomyces avicenniae]|uniref:hypothetical protein n=1 Tax=Streptomyces avicenniae TaxID=500153 RepID=UPI000B1D7CD9|nr:hypothetical protein [Streptomyces avicenniae]